MKNGSNWLAAHRFHFLNKMIKVQLHTHIKGNKEDPQVQYSLRQLIDKAKQKGFDALAVTSHNQFFYDKKDEDYANKLGITILWGIEKNIEGKHTLIINCDKRSEKVDDFKKLEDYRKTHPECLVIAPHPYFLLKDCHEDNIIKHERLFDAYEYSFFYTKIVNLNNKMMKAAKRFKKPVVGTSDVHYLEDIDLTYALVDSRNEKKDIIEAIKKGRVKLSTKPLSIANVIFRIIRIIYVGIKYDFRKA